MSDPIAWLESRGAQRDVLDGLREIARDWRTLWTECPRGDWLLGIAERLGVSHDLLLHAAIDAASLALAHLEGDAHARAEAVLEAARSKHDPTDALRALEAIPIHDPAADAASRAVTAVALGVNERDMLTAAATAAAEAEIVSSMDCGMEMAMRWAHDQTAKRVRAVIPYETIEAIVSTH